MAVAPLRSRDVRRWHGAASTAPASVMLDGDVPPGFQRLHETARLRRTDFDAAARDLLSWRLHEMAGLSVRTKDVPLREGTLVVLGLGVGPARVPIPCRVVEVIDEPCRQGFTYVTLPSHPECGIERFVVERRDDGIWVCIDAVSRPDWRALRPAAAVVGVVQRWMTRRYLRALDL